VTKEYIPCRGLQVCVANKDEKTGRTCGSRVRDGKCPAQIVSIFMSLEVARCAVSVTPMWVALETLFI